MAAYTDGTMAGPVVCVCVHYTGSPPSPNDQGKCTRMFHGSCSTHKKTDEQVRRYLEVRRDYAGEDDFFSFWETLLIGPEGVRQYHEHIANADVVDLPGLTVADHVHEDIAHGHGPPPARASGGGPCRVPLLAAAGHMHDPAVASAPR